MSEVRILSPRRRSRKLSGQAGVFTNVMTRALVSLCALALLLGASPKYDRPAIRSVDPDLVEAEKLWTAAENEKDPAQVAVAWERAAQAFTKVVEGKTASLAERRDAAYAAILAWKNALNVDPRIKPSSGDDPARDLDPAVVPKPKPIPPREQAMMKAFDAYIALGATSDDVPSMKFMKANIQRRYHHHDQAIPAFLEILKDHAEHEVAEYAANLLLDSYNLQHRYDELIAQAAVFRADKKFLADKPDLAQIVEQIHVVGQRKQAEALERVANDTGDLAAYERCGEAYVALAGDRKSAPGRDEILYNAMVCFQGGRSVVRAIAIGRDLLATYPTSRAAPMALGRIIVAESAIAHYEEAAEAAELFLKRYPREKDALYVASDALLYRMALGDWARAARLIDVALDLAGPGREAREVIIGATSVLAKMVAAGERKAAARRARVTAKLTARLKFEDTWGLWFAGRALVDAACAVEPVDGLCPRGRDRVVIKAARRLLDMAEHGAGIGNDPSTGDAADLAALALLDLDLEPVLAARRPAARALDEVRGGYSSLLDPETYVEVRIAASARLGQLARKTGDGTKALAHFRSCVKIARSTMSGADWLSICERGLSALKAADADLRPEHLAPSTAPVPMSTEGAITRAVTSGSSTP
jgi:tetratricopeptide (TPR) repeat protein